MDDRPVQFTCGQQKIICIYDCLGRRIDRLEYQGNILTLKEHFIYNGYVQIASFRSTEKNNREENYVLEKLYYWDPAQSIETRILSMKDTINSMTLYPAYDRTKNVTALYNAAETCCARYSYTPYGKLIPENSDDSSRQNPFRFSCEYSDDALDMIYFNYRYYNPNDGHWLTRDPFMENISIQLYEFAKNNPLLHTDKLGLWGGSDHEFFTQEALESLKAQVIYNSTGTRSSVTYTLRKDIINIIKYYNTKTDSGAKGKDQSFHFCWSVKDVDESHLRKVGKRNELIVKAKESYAENLKLFESSFKSIMYNITPSNPSGKKCKYALTKLGTLTHMCKTIMPMQ